MTNKANQTAPRLGTHALNRATLARQLLLHRAPVSAPAEAAPTEAAPTEATSTKATGSAAQPPPMSVHDAVTHLLGLQAQNVRPPYYALAARLDGFAPEQLSALMADRDVVRIVTMRSTIHTHTAEDCLSLRPLVQPARERELNLFRKGLAGVDLDRLEVIARELVEAEPRTLKQLREALIVEWPDADPFALGVAARCRLPLVQVTPRGLWGRSGQVALTTAEHWLGRPAEPAPAPETVVRRYLAAFGPASVKDMQSWAGLTRLREAFERLRPELLVFRDDSGTELFDLPDAPRPD
ncbi:winged helix DNA-binding domain-containing protein, partial [Streptomyces europaeiscabiei]